MTIMKWPADERPRERLLKYGASSLSNAELLAIFLRTGIKGKTAIDLARELLTTFGGIDKVLESSLKEFTQIHGLGSAKYCQLQATRELVRRHFACQVSEVSSFTDPELVRNYLLSQFPETKNEIFTCLFLDNKHQLLSFETLFSGTINHSQVYPRVVAQACLKNNAAAVIFSHNHPSGNLQPSESDVAITKKLISTLQLIDVRVLDHFIIGKNTVFSMAENGMM